MKRRLTAAIISVMVALPLAGCADDDPNIDNTVLPGDTLPGDTLPGDTTATVPGDTTPTTAAP